MEYHVVVYRKIRIPGTYIYVGLECHEVVYRKTKSQDTYIYVGLGTLFFIHYASTT